MMQVRFAIKVVCHQGGLKVQVVSVKSIRRLYVEFQICRAAILYLSLYILNLLISGCRNMSYTEEEVCPDVHDVIIVGAGPCGLAVAARLCEHTPSALFTDEEHQRYHWIKKHAAQIAIKPKKTGQIKPPSQHCRNYSTLVLDSSGHD